MSNIDETLAERGSRYGEFADHAEVTQSIKVAMASGNNWDTLDDDMKEAMEMVAHKFGRILNGDPYYVDSWTDCVGYIRLVEKRLIDEGEPTLAETQSGGRRQSFGEQVMGACGVHVPDPAAIKATQAEISAAIALLVKAGVVQVA